MIEIVNSSLSLWNTCRAQIAVSVMAAQETRGDCAQESSIVSKRDGMRRI